MCGRLNIHDHKGIQNFLDTLGLHLATDEFVPRYNVAPGAEIVTAARGEQPVIVRMRWGITPPWAKKQKSARDLINARSETVWEKPSFRHLIAGNRCIVPVNGFYEWRRSGPGKQPFYFFQQDNTTFGIAGIFQPQPGGPSQVCLLTTAANNLMAPVHNRMPVIISPDKMETWLGSGSQSEIDTLLGPAADESLDLCPVSSYVNSASHEGPDCCKCTDLME